MSRTFLKVGLEVLGRQGVRCEKIFRKSARWSFAGRALGRGAGRKVMGRKVLRRDERFSGADLDLCTFRASAAKLI
jgi:hypothetical protein